MTDSKYNQSHSFQPLRQREEEADENGLDVESEESDGNGEEAGNNGNGAAASAGAGGKKKFWATAAEKTLLMQLVKRFDPHGKVCSH